MGASAGVSEIKPCTSKDDTPHAHPHMLLDPPPLPALALRVSGMAGCTHLLSRLAAGDAAADLWRSSTWREGPNPSGCVSGTCRANMCSAAQDQALLAALLRSAHMQLTHMWYYDASHAAQGWDQSTDGSTT